VNGSHLLELEGLSVRRGLRVIIHNVTISVNASERVALVGPNAAGKSTLLSAIAGLLPAAAGEVRLFDRSLSSLSNHEIARQVALVVALQEGAPKISVRESTELGRYPHTGPLKSLSGPDRDAVSLAISETNLLDLAERSLGSLSAGERQRALVARALAQEPALLLLDEPSAHLDVGHGLDLFALLTSIAANGVAIVAVIHDLVAAAQWASRMIVLSDGRVVDDGPPSAVMKGRHLGRAFGVSISEARTENGTGGSTWRFERTPDS
jgi:iron complex transport system ATP-binding protein